MNCTAFRSAISDAVEHRQPLRTELAAHLVDCRDAACRQAWDDAVLLDRAIDSWRHARPAVDVVEAVLSACQSTHRPPASPLASGPRDAHASNPARSTPAAARAATAVAVAAVALLALVLRPAGVDPPVATHAPAPASRDPAGDASLTYVTYAQNAAQIVTDAVVLTLGGSDQMEASTVTPPGIGWETNWPPLGEVHAALDDLLESVPAEPPQS